jgi:hypothetical protein
MRTVIAAARAAGCLFSSIPASAGGAGFLDRWLDQQAPECVPVSAIKSASTVTDMTPEQFQFVRALYVALPPMAVLLGVLWLQGQREGIFLVPPFVATMTILLYLPNVAIAQPFAIVCGSTFGAAIGAVLRLLLGSGPGVAMAAALTALIVLPLPGLSSARRRFGHVSGPAASRLVVRRSGRAAVHARRGDLRRSDEPAAAQLAAISRSALRRNCRAIPLNHRALQLNGRAAEFAIE